MTDDPICGAPTSRRDGSPCQRRVPREGLRCYHHPKPDIEDAESRPEPARANDAGLRGSWPSADEVAAVSAPVRTLSADGAGDVDGCELCGGEKPDGYYLELEYPPDSEADPGMLAGSICGDCAAGWATNLLVDRAISRDIDIFEGL